MAYSFEDLLGIVDKLRGEDGCPWDREQTHQSLRGNVVEEAWEVVDAIDKRDPARLHDELGDVLLQVVMHAAIARDQGEFTLEDVTDSICRKLIYRHPHIFKDVEVSGTEEVLANWETLKKKEKGLATQGEVLRDVPKGFPAVLRAHKVQKKARQVGFDWDDAEGGLMDVEEELAELREALATKNPEEIEHEAGDLLFAAVNAARLSGVDSETALQKATERFIERFVLMEELVTRDDKKLQEMELESMDEYWEKAKKLLNQATLD